MKAPLDIHRQAALMAIREMLGLEDTKLTRATEETLLELFYSVAHVHRHDGLILSQVLRPALATLQAFDWAETRETVAKSPALQEMLRTISTRAAGLAAA